ncbi:MAG: hypothetical protein GY940_03390 [bacterium]|nr:hypothetical protein [bacterium]
MKIKKFDKKLVLNKELVANLGNGDLKEAKGGIKLPPVGATNPTIGCMTCMMDIWTNCR